MKVVFLIPMAGKNVIYYTGVVYDIEKGLAERLIKKGICILDDTKEVEVKKAVVGRKSKVIKKKNNKK